MTPASTARRVPLSALAVIIAFVLAACSGTTSDTGTTPDTSVAPAGDSTTIDVSAKEFTLTLASTPTTAGTYTFVLTNDGTMTHDLVLEGGPGGRTSRIGPGESDQFTVTLEPGDYTLFCSVGNHRAQGMEVSFSVS